MPGKTLPEEDRDPGDRGIPCRRTYSEYGKSGDEFDVDPVGDTILIGYGSSSCSVCCVKKFTVLFFFIGYFFWF